MYSVKDRVWYVEAMWRDGLTVAEAARKWGMSRQSLTAWEKAAKRGDLPAQKPPVRGEVEHAKHSRYPEETKSEAVRRVLAGEKAPNVARSLGVSSDAVASWVRKARESARMSLPGAEGAPERKAQKVAANKGDDERVRELEAELEESKNLVRALMELMRDPKAEGPARASRMLLVASCERLRLETGISLRTLLRFTGMPKSTYERWRKRLLEGAAEDDPSVLDAAVLAAFEKGRRTYGYRRVRAQMALDGVAASERAVRASMKRQGLVARCQRAVKGSYSSYEGEVGDDNPENLLLTEHMRHDFSAAVPNEKWLTDVTEMRASDSKLYLSPIVDCFDGLVVSFSMSAHPDSELADAMLAPALAGLGLGEKPLIHSDRGALYQANRWVGACEGKAVRSMSRKGHSPDNAACEAFFGRMKAELYHAVEWRGLTFDELAAAVDDYIRWYNEERLKRFVDEDGTVRYESIMGRRRRLGLAV